MKRWWLSVGCLLVIGCVRSDARTLVVTGSSTIAPVMNELARSFEAQHPGTRIDVQSGGSSRGIADVRNGLAGLGMVSRDLTEEEGDLTAFPIARDGLCVITHRDNPVSALTRQQVAAIYRKEITHWNELTGSDLPIVVVHKADGRSTLELFLAFFGLGPTDVEPDVIIGDNEQGIKTVAGAPGAIGYVSLGAAHFNIDAGMAIQALVVDGVTPSLDAVASGAFPFSRVLNLITAAPPEGLTAEFLAYAQSIDAHTFIRAHALVPITP